MQRPAASSRTSDSNAAEYYAPDRLYDPAFVRLLFNEMSASYGLTNFISSFGFCWRWRQECIRLADIGPGHTVYDLMSGMAECVPLIARELRGQGEVVALDFSEEMAARAAGNAARAGTVFREFKVQDFLNNDIPDASADRVVSCFGLKTFSPDQQKVAARQIARILKPGGRCALLEISVPSNTLLRVPYLMYIDHVIPVIGKVLLGNPDNYRMLGAYTKAFGSCAVFAELLSDHGLSVSQQPHFWGCASSVVGIK